MTKKATHKAAHAKAATPLPVTEKEMENVYQKIGDAPTGDSNADLTTLETDEPVDHEPSRPTDAIPDEVVTVTKPEVYPGSQMAHFIEKLENIPTPTGLSGFIEGTEENKLSKVLTAANNLSRLAAQVNPHECTLAFVQALQSANTDYQTQRDAYYLSRTGEEA